MDSTYKNEELIFLSGLREQIPGPPEQYNLSPLLLHMEKVFASIFSPPSICASSNQQMTCKTPTLLLLRWVEKWTKDPGSPLSWPAILTASPTLINFISLSFCLMSGNSFPIRAWTTTFLVAYTGHGPQTTTMYSLPFTFHKNKILL